MNSKKIIAAGAFAAVILIACGIHGAQAALPSWLSTSTQLSGYRMVWNDTISVQWTSGNQTNNVTCYTNIWLKNGTSGVTNASIIGASMLDKGGNVFDKTVDLTKTDLGTTLAKGFLKSHGVNDSAIAGIHTIWDVCVALLKGSNSTNYTVSTPTIPNLTHALLFSFPSAPYFKYVLLGTHGDRVLVVFNFDASQDWINWINATGHGTDILRRIQGIVWGFWIVVYYFVAIIVTAANWLGLSSSSVPAATSTEKSIELASYTPTTDMTSFASAWGALFNTSIPSYDPLIIVAFGATITGVLAIKMRRARKE